MNLFETPELEFGTVERQLKCRAIMEAALKNLVAAGTKLGWCENELALAFADAAEDYVIQLAMQKRLKN